MKRIFNIRCKQLTAYCIGIGLMCSATSSCNSMSDATATKAQGTSIGALGGAAIGTGIGALAGGKNRGAAMLIGGLAGGLLGGIIGHQWAKSVVKKKAAYASTEDWIKANSKQLDTRIKESRKLNASLNKQIATLTKQNATLSKSDFAAIKKDVTQKVGYIDTDIATTKANLRGETSTASIADLQKKVKELEAERQGLLNGVAQLGRKSARV